MLRFINVWVLLTLGLFYFGPVDWPAARGVRVALVVLASLFAFNVGARISYRAKGTTYVAKKRLPVPQSDAVCWGLIAAYAALTFLFLYFSTGLNALSRSSYSVDFGRVYADYVEAQQFRVRGGLGMVTTTVKALLFPVILLIFVDRFAKNWRMVAAILVPMVVSSLLRGTDKEMVDVLILIVVASALHGKLTRRVLLYGSIAPVVLALFFLRKIARFGGEPPQCLPESVVCFDYHSMVARLLGRNAEILVTFLTNYVTQGYQGMYLATTLPWQPQYGLGHIPPLNGAYCQVTGMHCDPVDYLTLLAANGWDTSTRWTSAFTMIANDVSFFLVPMVMFLFGLIFAKSKALWASSRDAGAGVALLLLMMFWLYSSANYQIGISLDWGLATVLLLYLAAFRPVRKVADPVPLRRQVAIR